MRVCHLGKYYPPAPGGIETHLQTLARAQSALGLDVDVICLNHERTPTTLEQDGSVRMRRFNGTASMLGLRYSRKLIAAICATKADIFHVQVPNPVMLLHAYFAGIKAPLIVTYHSDNVRQRARAVLFRPFERLFYKKVVKILATSHEYADGSPFLRPYRDRVEVFPLGLDLSPYLHPSAEHARFAEELKSRYKQPIWLCCGRLVYYKGLMNAIRALESVPGTLILVGSGPELDALRAEANALKLGSRVVFIGYLPSYLDIVPYYLAATALWFPSNARSEAFGLVQVEAMASGCPVINTAIPDSGVAWVSPHEKTGLTIPMNDPAALAAAALRLLNEPGLRERFSAAGKVRAQEEFDHVVMARRSIEIYKKFL